MPMLNSTTLNMTAMVPGRQLERFEDELSSVVVMALDGALWRR